MTLRAPQTLGLVALTLLAGGCSSGVFVKTVTRPTDTGEVPRAQTVPSAPYSPNYRSSLRDGFFWNKTELTVFFTNGTPTQQETTLTGAALWAGFPGSPFTFRRVESAAGADVQVSFLPPSDPSFSDGSAGSSTMYPAFGSQELVRAEIVLRNDVTGENLKTLSAHEFGHALGIDGHSQDAPDCMNEYAPNPGRITQPDANTLALIYDQGRNQSRSRSFHLGKPRHIACPSR
jgi:hypothetical protein